MFICVCGYNIDSMPDDNRHYMLDDCVKYLVTKITKLEQTVEYLYLYGDGDMFYAPRTF